MERPDIESFYRTGYPPELYTVRRRAPHIPQAVRQQAEGDTDANYQQEAMA